MYIVAFDFMHFLCNVRQLQQHSNSTPTALKTFTSRTSTCKDCIDQLYCSGALLGRMHAANVYIFTEVLFKQQKPWHRDIYFVPIVSCFRKCLFSYDVVTSVRIFSPLVEFAIVLVLEVLIKGMAMGGHQVVYFSEPFNSGTLSTLKEHYALITLCNVHWL